MILAILETGKGFWEPITFLAFALLVCLAMLIIRMFGRKGFTYSKSKARAFFSGNLTDENTRVKASDYFWGFFEAMKPYYNLIMKIHTGIINDYVLWFIIVASLLLIALTLGVFQWA